jgi:GT2 family glycosyltransferase
VTFSIGYIHPGVVHHPFLLSLLRAMEHPQFAHRIAVCTSGLLASARNDIVEAFLGTDSDYLWFVDSDMVFNADYFDDLAAHDKGVCGALYYSLHKDMSYKFPVVIEDKAGKLTRAEGDLNKLGLVEVAGIGMGCCLIRREVFEAIAKTHNSPLVWFQETVRGDDAIGEDTEFCLRAKEAGFPCFIDTNLIAGHLKTVIV